MGYTCIPVHRRWIAAIELSQYVAHPVFRPCSTIKTNITSVMLARLKAF